MAAVFAVVFLVYSPALRGDFVFDDLHMPFFDPHAPTWPITLWWGVRPLLMTTFYVNLHSAGLNPFSYHVVNVLFHITAGTLLFFAIRRILDLGNVQRSKVNLLACFAAGVFLLHPIQTEAVAYVAQRGEDLGAVFYLAAFCVFLYRGPGPLSWARTAAVLVLFLAAVTTKEHTVTLPALLLLTDYYWNPGFSLEGIKRNWRLYSVVGLGLIVGIGFVWYYVGKNSTSIGFNLPDFTASQYLYTQFRVFFAYLGLFVYPFWQTIDYDFAVSKTLADHGAVIGLLAIVALAAAAFRYRRRFPLASYGFLAFGLLLLPTSSVVPIRDVIADRRLYLPLFGLLLVSLELLRRWDISRRALTAVCAGICVLLALGSYRRNEKWANAPALWADAVEKSPGKQRVQFGFAVAQFLAGRCRESIPHYESAILLGKPDNQIYMNLGMAYDCDHQTAKALQALKTSIELQPTAQSLASLAYVEAKSGMLDDALAALDKAEGLDARYPMTYVYRGGIFQVIGRLQDAAAQYRRALEIDPGNAAATQALEAIRAGLATPRA